MIRIENLSKSYGKKEILKNLNLEIKDGEIVALIGLNGSGKSTLIELICGVKKFKTGEIFIDNHNIKDKKNSLVFRHSFGYMPQHFSLFNDLTVKENLDYMRCVYMIEDKNRTEEMMKICFLKDKKDMLAKNLSGGYKQLLSLACSFIHKPKLLILDEPTSAMDPLFRKQFWSIIHGLNKNGTTIFVTTHHMEEVFECVRLDLLNNGQIVFSGKVDEIFKSGEFSSIEDVIKKYIYKDKYEKG